MLHAGLKAGALFLASLLALYILLKTLLPPIDEEHRERVKLPKTFEELKGLNEVLQVSFHYAVWTQLVAYVTASAERPARIWRRNPELLYSCCANRCTKLATTTEF